MPSPKRWFPVSHDLFDDPELLEFLRLFGDRAIFTWLWFLSALDRADNHLRLSGDWLRSLSRRLRQTPASLSRQLAWMLAKGWLATVQTAPDGSPTVLRAPNYWKYHRTREHKGDNVGSLLTEPSEPSKPSPHSPPGVEELALARFEDFRKAYPPRDGVKIKPGLIRAQELFLKLSPEEQVSCVMAVKAYARDCAASNRKPKDPDNFLQQEEGEPWREYIPSEPARPVPKPQPPEEPLQTRSTEEIRRDLEKTPVGRLAAEMAQRNTQSMEAVQTGEQA